MPNGLLQTLQSK